MYHAIPIGVQDAGGKGQNSSCFNVAIVSMHIYIYIYIYMYHFHTSEQRKVIYHILH